MPGAGRNEKRSVFATACGVASPATSTISPMVSSRSSAPASAGVIRIVQTSSRCRAQAEGPIKAMPALSGPRHARASSIASTTRPVWVCRPAVLSQKPTIPHIPLTPPLQIEVVCYQIYWLDRPVSPTIDDSEPVATRARARCEPAGSSRLQKGPAYACPTWKNSLSSWNGDFKTTRSPTC